MNARIVLEEMPLRSQGSGWPKADEKDIEQVVKEIVQHLRQEVRIQEENQEALRKQVLSAAKMVNSKKLTAGEPERSDFLMERSLLIATWVNSLS